MKPEIPDRLRRELGLLDAVGIGLGAVMGAGLFVVTGVAAGVAGPSFLLGLMMAGVAATFNALSSAQLAVCFPESGGTYEYGYRCVAPVAGFAAGWMFLASKLAAAGTVALGFGHYAAALLSWGRPSVLAAAAVAVLTVANLFGIRRVGALNLGIVALTLIALAVFVIGGAGSVRMANLRPFAPHGWRGVMESGALLFFAYTGYARLATLGEEVRDPARTIPRAIILTLVLSFVVYLAVGFIAVGTVGAPAMADSRSPLDRAAVAFPVPWISGVVAVGATAAMLGVLLSQILGISRMMFAMARRGDLPAALARVDAARGVPARSIGLTGAIALGLTLAGTLESIVAAAAFTILVYYGITNLAALRLRADDRRYHQWIAWAGLAACAVLALSLPLRTAATGMILLAAGFLFRWRLHRFAPPPPPPASDRR